jgi:ATP diphosphatase
MAEERQAFAFADVVEAITTKMIRRHPHVFGTEAERAAGAAPGFWERIKAAEKAAEVKRSPPPGGEGSGVGGIGVLDDVPAGFPALTRAVKLQHKAAKVGFDWPSLAPVFAKCKEEIAELEEAIANDRKLDGSAGEAVTEEFGDLLFVMANVARHLKIDPEAALRAANGKFVRRFQRIEVLLAADGRTPSQSTLAEMDRLWDQAKEEERE